MKKKGLIVATIVMVLVLAVSLTTATYAWFTNEGSASVDLIEFSVGASSDILIGVSNSNTIVETPVPTSFYADGTTYSINNNTWTGDTNALGLSISHNVNLEGMSKAVYSFTESAGTYTQDTYTATETVAPNTSHGTLVTAGISKTMANIYKASGNGANFTNSSVEPAVANGDGDGTNGTQKGDYLYASFGAAPGKSDVLAYGCLVYIHPTDSKQTLGLNAAIHVAYRTQYNGSWTEVDVYGTNTHAKYKSGAQGMSAPTMPTVSISNKTVTYKGSSYDQTRSAGDAYVFIPLDTASTSTSYLSVDTIKQVEMIIYICGRDSDCITSATGVSANITIEFLSINATQYAAQGA